MCVREDKEPERERETDRQTEKGRGPEGVIK